MSTTKTVTINIDIKIDVVIPCYNAQDTIVRAVESVLVQEHLGKIYLIDDGSTDKTWEVISQLKKQHRQIQILKFAKNKGVSTARNVGAMTAESDFIAFLDADDTYQSQTFQACAMAFANFDVGLIRLPMTPIDMPAHFATHANFATAWRTFEMTAGGNMVFYRPYFLVLGGFDDDPLFKKFGGEDGALGLACLNTSVVGTLFDNHGFEVGVNYYCHENMYARHLLDSMLFDKNTRNISQEELDRAEQSTQYAIFRVQKLQRIINGQTGQRPIILN